MANYKTTDQSGGTGYTKKHGIKELIAYFNFLSLRQAWEIVQVIIIQQKMGARGLTNHTSFLDHYYLSYAFRGIIFFARAQSKKKKTHVPYTNKKLNSSEIRTLEKKRIRMLHIDSRKNSPDNSQYEYSR